MTELQLREERLLAAENSRLERGLLPRPLLRTDAVHCASHYRPGRARAVLGGDFFDVVETADGRIRAVIGDVMGHGPDEAALGVHLRVAWRAMVLADVPDSKILGTLAQLLEAERTGDVFVTLCDATLDRDLGLSVRVAGHPPPLLCQRGSARYAEVVVEPPLGIREDPVRLDWPVTRTQLEPGDAVMLYTDGLLDAFRHGERRRQHRHRRAARRGRCRAAGRPAGVRHARPPRRRRAGPGGRRHRARRPHASGTARR